MMRRNPVTGPHFGDIFRHNRADPAEGELVLYLAPADRGLWQGMIVRRSSESLARPVGTIYSDWVSIHEWVVVEQAEIFVEMICDHGLHRGKWATLDYANDIWRGCTYRRVA